MGRTKWQNEHPERCRELARKWREKNHDHVLKKKKEFRERHRKELARKQRHYHKKIGWYRRRQRNIRIKEQLIAMLGDKCKICGYKKYLGALEFHHINPNEKESNRAWRSAKLRKQFIEKIKQGKIRLLCNRCHRELHLEEMNDRIEKKLQECLRSKR